MRKKELGALLPDPKEQVRIVGDTLVLDRFVKEEFEERLCIRKNKEFLSYDGNKWYQKEYWSFYGYREKEEYVGTVKGFYEKYYGEWPEWRMLEVDCIIGVMQSDILDQKREKREEKRREKIERYEALLRKPTKSMEKWVKKKLIPKHYMFYRSKGKNAYCTCSSCMEKVIIARKEYGVKHNAEGVCPECGEDIIFKAAGRKNEIAEKENMVRLQNTKKGIVCITSAVRKESSEKGESVVIFDYMAEWPGYRLCKRELFGGRKGWTWQWDDRNTHCLKNGEEVLYTGNLKRNLKGTEYEHCAIDLYAKCKKHIWAAGYLDRYQRNPFIESMLKVGLTNLVIERGDCICDGTERSLNKILGIRKDKMKRLIDMNGGRVELEIMRLEEKNKKPFTKEEFEMIKLAGIREANEIMTYTTLKKAWKYCKENKYGDLYVAEWLDYLRMAKMAGWNMKDDFVLFPKNMVQEHNNLIILTEKKAKEKEEEKYRKRKKELRKYKFEYEELMIIIPETLSRISLEGKKLHHCVGTYIKRVANGETDILFIRKKGREDESYYTMEVKDDRVMQYRGAYNNQNNNPVPEEVHEFVRQFKKKVLEKARKKVA